MTRRFDEPLAFLLAARLGRRSGSASRSSRSRPALVARSPRPPARPGPAPLLARALRSALSAPLPRLARRANAQLRRAARAAHQPVAPRGRGCTRSRRSRSSPCRSGSPAGAAPRPPPLATRRAAALGRRPRPDLLRVARDPRPDARRLRRDALARGRRSTSATTPTARRSRGSRRSTARATSPARGATPRPETSTPRSRVTHGRPRRRLRHRPRPAGALPRAHRARTSATPRMGVVQTPHHFYNPDVFQRAFGAPACRAERGGPLQPRDPGRRATAGAARSSSGAARCSGARRIASVGGFNLLSITEDIHTSQKLHAKGWRSAFVDEDLAAGLSAENVQSYLVQRRRWMLGCLQIFFRDNPLLERGLPLRHRIGYFASLWYFFFPLARRRLLRDARSGTCSSTCTRSSRTCRSCSPTSSRTSCSRRSPRARSLPGLAAMLLWGRSTRRPSRSRSRARRSTSCLPKRLGFKVTPKGIVSRPAPLRRGLVAAHARRRGARGGRAREGRVRALRLRDRGGGLRVQPVLGGREPRRDPRGARRRVGAAAAPRATSGCGRRVAVRLEGGGARVAAETVDLSTTGRRPPPPAGAPLPARASSSPSAAPSRLRVRGARSSGARRSAASSARGSPSRARRPRRAAPLVRIAFSRERPSTARTTAARRPSS